MTDEMTIKDITKTYGISRRTIQGYESCQLIKPSKKSPRGHLIYDDRTVRKMVGMDLDHDRKRKVMSAKKSDGTFVFGGCSIYGSIIDAACERYGWTLEYVVWGISHINLMMMLSDQVSSVFLSKEEKKDAHISNDRDVIMADDKRNNKKILEMFKGQ